MTATVTALRRPCGTAPLGVHHCVRCGAPIGLAEHPHADEGRGVRAYCCGLCQHVTRFYSAAWL